MILRTRKIENENAQDKTDAVRYHEVQFPVPAYLTWSIGSACARKYNGLMTPSAKHALISKHSVPTSSFHLDLQSLLDGP